MGDGRRNKIPTHGLKMGTELKGDSWEALPVGSCGLFTVVYSTLRFVIAMDGRGQKCAQGVVVDAQISVI